MTTIWALTSKLWRDRTQIVSCGLGITGAALVSQIGAPLLLLFGFGCWIISNIVLIYIEWQARHLWLAGMFGVYEITALIGFWNAVGMVWG